MADVNVLDLSEVTPGSGDSLILFDRTTGVAKSTRFNELKSAVKGTLDSQVQALEDNDDVILNVLGAKNLLPNNATSQVLDGITYQLNPNGSVTALNGKALNGASLQIYGNEIYCETDMILSGCPSGGGNSSYSIWCQIKNSQNVYADLGEGVLIPKGTTIYNICIGVAKDYTISNKTFYPMLRPASIKDDTYVPYAMTNRQLSEVEHIGDATRFLNFSMLSSGVAEWINVPRARVTNKTLYLQFGARLNPDLISSSAAFVIFNLTQNFINRLDKEYITNGQGLDVICGSGNNYDGINVRAVHVAVNGNGSVALNNGVNGLWLPYVFVSAQIPLRY